MWQQFTPQAKRAVCSAQDEARRLGETYPSTEHILLGLIADKENAVCRLLARWENSLDYIQSEVKRNLARTALRGNYARFTPRAWRILVLAQDEAQQQNSGFIGTLHIQIGLIREGEGLAAIILRKMGIEAEAVRRECTGDHLTLENETSSQEVPAMPLSLLRTLIQEDPTGWRKKSVISLFDFSGEQIRTVLEVAAGLKKYDLARERSLFWQYPRTLALIFEKPSLRTRVSFEAGMAHLQGATIYLAPGDVGLGTREAVPDVAGALSRWVDIISARVFKHETVEELAAHSTIPVINALSDREHPIQAFADLLTLQEQKGPLGNNLTLAYIGDGNNVLHALLLACAKMGVNLNAACPQGYDPAPAYVEEARRIGQQTGAQISLVREPVEAVRDADAVYTDVWASMGQEEEKEARAQIFAGYFVDKALLAHARPDVIVMHDLPAHRGEEIAADVMDAHNTVIMDQAENRLHTQKALLVLILGL